VPRDMGVGGAIQAEDVADQISAKANAALTRPTTQDVLRQGLGIDEAPEQFDFVEEATQAIEAAQSVEELNKLRSRWTDFQGEDVQIIARAYEDRLRELD